MDYLSKIDYFYNELFNQYNKKKTNNCKGCSSEMIISYKLNNGEIELIINCGGNSKECGEIFSLKIPNYKNYNTYKNELNQLINNPINYNKLSEYIPSSHIDKYNNERDKYFKELE